MYVVLTDWKLFIKLLLSIVVPPQKTSSNEMHDYEYVNSVIASKTPGKNTKANTSKSGNRSNSAQLPLNAIQRRDNIVRCYNDLIDVINFLSLSNLGCIHLRSDWYLHCGENKHLPSHWPNKEQPVCGNKCYVCKGTYDKYMLSIMYEGAYLCLKSDYFSATGSMSYPISNDNYNDVIDKLWDSGDWMKLVFGVKKVAIYIMNPFMFQLLATGILCFEWTNATTGVVLVLAKNNEGVFKYQSLSN